MVFSASLILFHSVLIFADESDDNAVHTNITSEEQEEDISEMDISGEPETPNPSQTDIVYDEYGLEQWITEHKDTGGTVSLGRQITITHSMGIYGFSGYITIDTGKYGLIFDGGTLPDPEIFITGEGIDMPVVKVLRTGSGSFWENSSNNELVPLNITSVGRDGIGGTALHILTVDAKTFNMDCLTQGMIRSYGEGAVGIWLEPAMEAWCYQVEVFGENSIAVYAPKGADLYYCKLSAEGNGASAVFGNNLMLDSCTASPEPMGVKRLRRRALEESFSQLYLPLMQNSGYDNSIHFFNSPNVFLSGGEGFSGVTRSFPIFWDMDAYQNIDTSILGKTPISGTTSPAFYGLGIFEDISIELTVEVRDPDLPCISMATVQESDGRQLLRLNFWKSYDPEDESVILWRSDNEGGSWQNATHSKDIEWLRGSVYFTFEELEHPIWFQLEIIDSGKSNIAVLDERDTIFTGGNGGDRTGTDRDGVKPPGSDGSSHSDKNESVPDTIRPSGSAEHDIYETKTDNTGSTPENQQESEKPSIADVNLDSGIRQALLTGIFLPKIKIEPASFHDSESDTPSGRQIIQTDPMPEDSQKPLEDWKQESFTEPAPAQQLPNGNQTQLFEPEQSAPEPGFNINTMTIFFLFAAAVGSITLLLLHLFKLRRPGYGKQ